MEEIERFKGFAKANGYAVDLLSGKIELLKEYVDFIFENDEETLPGLVTILKSQT